MPIPTTTAAATLLNNGSADPGTNNSTQNPGLSCSDIITLVIGIVGTLIAFLTLVQAWKCWHGRVKGVSFILI